MGKIPAMSSGRAVPNMPMSHIYVVSIQVLRIIKILASSVIWE